MNDRYEYIPLTQNESSFDEEFVENERRQKLKFSLDWVSIFSFTNINLLFTNNVLYKNRICHYVQGYTLKSFARFLFATKQHTHTH